MVWPEAALSSALPEGRGPSTPGGARASEYPGRHGGYTQCLKMGVQGLTFHPPGAPQGPPWCMGGEWGLLKLPIHTLEQTQQGQL